MTYRLKNNCFPYNTTRKLSSLQIAIIYESSIFTQGYAFLEICYENMEFWRNRNIQKLTKNYLSVLFINFVRRKSLFLMQCKYNFVFFFFSPNTRLLLNIFIWIFFQKKSRNSSLVASSLIEISFIINWDNWNIFIFRFEQLRDCSVSLKIIGTWQPFIFLWSHNIIWYLLWSNEW